jgi:hypothetical protein
MLTVIFMLTPFSHGALLSEWNVTVSLKFVRTYRIRVLQISS